MLLQDGGLLFQKTTPLRKIDACSNLMFQNTEDLFHHSLEKDFDGNIWAMSHLYPQSLPENITVCSFIIVQISGTDKYVLCFDLNPAKATRSLSGVSPSRIAAMIFCCAGQIRNHTLNAIIVPNMAPICILNAR